MIAVRDLCVRAGGFGLDRVTFDVPGGGYAVLMGRTGSGKTTLLEALCGVKAVDSGRVVLGGRDATFLRPADRGVGYVPQDRALFQTLSVYENVAFALRVRRRPRAEVDARVRELGERLGIAALLGRMPSGLSGGEAQRVALGRALAARPAVLLLDEPLSALDDSSRRAMHEVLKDVRAAERPTTLHVTHHEEDADRLADFLLTMEAGRVRPGGPRRGAGP